MYLLFIQTALLNSEVNVHACRTLHAARDTVKSLPPGTFWRVMNGKFEWCDGNSHKQYDSQDFTPKWQGFVY